MRGAGSLIGGAVNGLMNGGGHEAAVAQDQLLNQVLAARQQSDDYTFEQQDYDDSDLMAAVESLPEEARTQFLGALLSKLLG